MDDWLSSLIPLQFKFYPEYGWSKPRLWTFRVIGIVFNYSQVFIMLALMAAAVRYGWER